MGEPFVLAVQLDGVCAGRPGEGAPVAFADRDTVPGAAEALWRLSDAGVWVRLVTRRLADNWGHRDAVVETVDWLDRARIPYRDLCFLGAKPEVEANLYVSDDPDDIRTLRRKGNAVIVFDIADIADIGEARDPRATSWEELEELVVTRFTEHSGVHGVALQLPGVDGPLGRRLGDD